jgi:hypothetical protein
MLWFPATTGVFVPTAAMARAGLLLIKKTNNET